MPRLLSSYAANKRVEDGLKRKQEQIRQDYMKATHRHLDETDKLVDDLIQIQVRTPSAFQSTPIGSAASLHRRLVNHPNQHYHHQQQQQGAGLPPPHGHHPLDYHAPVMRSRSRGGLANDGSATTDDGASSQKKDIPLPIVQVRGNEVFYQYDRYPNTWKKVEPTYKTKVLLHRNNTVSQALKQFAQQRNRVSSAPANEHGPASGTDDKLNSRRESQAGRKASVISRRDSEFGRRSSMFSRRSSRRGSRFFKDDDESDEEEDRAQQIVELKPQLSPGHTPRMLDGWTIMNWCLWNKQQSKPVWATKRYIERKKREYKRFQASRSASDTTGQPPKPSSANASSREARKQSTFAEEDIRSIRAKSVPIQRRNTTTIEEVDEEIDDLDEFPEVAEPDRPVLRPTTSILRSSTEPFQHDENRPKTTNQRRRVALDTFIAQDNGEAHTRSGSRPGKGRMGNYVESDYNNDDENLYSFHEATQDILILRPKSIRKEGRTISIDENPQVISETDRNTKTSAKDSAYYSVLDQPVDKKSLLERMPGLAATHISVREDTTTTTITNNDTSSNNNKNDSIKPKQPTILPGKALRPSQQINVNQASKPILPMVKAMVPELGTDSPR